MYSQGIQTDEEINSLSDARQTEDLQQSSWIWVILQGKG